MKITIVGLGTSEGDITLDAYNTILNADRNGKKLIFKTEKGLYSAFSKLSFEALDSLYQEYPDFDSLNEAIAKRIFAEAKKSEVVFCVGGCAVTDYSVGLILKGAKDVEVVAGHDYSVCALRYAPSGAYSVLSALDACLKLCIDTSMTLIITEIDNKELAGDLKLHLGNFYEDSQEAVYLFEGKPKRIKLFELDRQKNYNHTSAVVFEKNEYEKKTRFSFEDLLLIMQRLTGENGCEWDKAQTHESIRTNLIEEAYEVLEAIDKQDYENLTEELGDLMLQSVFHAVIAQKNDEFSVGDVLDRLCKKLLDRHPHVFKSQKAETANEALGSWENAKAKEKDEMSFYEELKSIPAVFPQTLRAVKTGKKASKAGIGKDVDISLCCESAVNAIISLKETQTEYALGEALYALSTMARLLRLDPEIALKKTIDRYLERIKKIEGGAFRMGKLITELSESELMNLIASTVYEE